MTIQEGVASVCRLIGLRHERKASDGFGEDCNRGHSLLGSGGKVAPNAAELCGALRTPEGA